MPKNKTHVYRSALFLLAAAYLLYWPSLHGRFLWDDDAYISQNTALASAAGLHDIWLRPGSVQQYYPATFTVFWMEYHLWGLNPAGYHAVNIFLHGLNALLLGILLEALGMPGAWIAAWLFALHPVMVESVAWMTELKNVLSTFFYLLTALFLFKSERRVNPKFSAYVLAVVFFAGALFSKSITVTLPIAYLLIDRWMTGSWSKRKIIKVLPMMGLALAVGFFTLHFEHHLVGAEGNRWTFPWNERLLIAGHAFWFYLGKLFYPSPLVFIYPKWSTNTQNPFLYLYPALAVIFVGLSAYGQKWWGKLPFACFLFFTISLAPVLGLTSFYFMRFSFAADHFQYLASIGILTLMAYALTRLLKALQVPADSLAGNVVIGLLGVNLALATFRQAGYYGDSAKLWQHTLDFNPYSAIAHHNLGIALAEQNQWADAIAHLRTAETLDPSFPQTHLAIAYFALRAGRRQDARHEYQEAIRLGLRDPQVLKDYAVYFSSPS